MMNKIYMDFNDARECTHIIYENRGYPSACDFINMMNNFELINLDDRIKLKEYINVFEKLKIKQKREKKLAQKIRKKLK